MNYFIKRLLNLGQFDLADRFLSGELTMDNEEMNKEEMNKEENRAIESAYRAALDAFNAACSACNAAWAVSEAANTAKDVSQDAYEAAVVSTYGFYEAFILAREALEAASKEGAEK